MPHRILRLLRGGAAGRARRERERRGRCGVRAGRALPRHGVSRPKRRRHPELVARAAHAHDGILPGAGPEGPRAVGGRHPAHVRALARVGAPHGAVGAQRRPLRCAGHRPRGQGAHHVHAVPVLAGSSEHVQRERARVRSRDPDVPGADASVGRAVDEGASRTIRTTSRARRRTGRSWPSAVATGWTPASKWSATRRAPTRASCRPTPAPPIPRRKRRTHARSFAKPS